MKKLNLGCGTDIRSGWVNMDCANLPGVDVIHDANSVPYPFENDCFDEILAQDVLEHIDLCKVMEELFRIMRKGGVLTIRVPHFTSRNNYIDPTHKNRFSAFTFEFFVRNGFFKRDYYFSNLFDAVVSTKITFAKHPVFFYNYFVEFLVNRSKFLKNYYESTFLSRLFPAENILVSLRK
ncbi:MAG: class I SAM-dependent methyltransferase [Ignavibacteriales bacterium]